MFTESTHRAREARFVHHPVERIFHILTQSLFRHEISPLPFREDKDLAVLGYSQDFAKQGC
jgi:hypothetical protein